MSVSGAPEILPLPGASRAEAPIDVARLRSADGAQLQAWFECAPATQLEQVAGDPVGWVIATPVLRAAPAARVLRWVAGSPLMVWEGKSFLCAGAAGSGHGVNRTRIRGRWGLAPFAVRPGVSVVDGRPALAIDYDLPGNPRAIRPIYDELRQVAPGLHLGRGMYRLGAGRGRLLLWFAVDSSRQDTPLP